MNIPRQIFPIILTALGWTLLAPTPALAQVDPLSGIDFVTIGATNGGAGSAPWPGGAFPMNNLVGRGSVAYEYRIGRFEITTSQWAEFMTAAFNRAPSDWIPHLSEPQYWGAGRTSIGAVPGGRRYVTGVNGAMLGVGGITWRQAALYCNWLHNNKSLDHSAFLSGAYDVSMFGYIGNIFTDQAQRSAGAKYFIPTLDEWMKAAHYDPHRYGANQEGWWLYSHTSDVPAIPGPPGEITPGGPTQANYGNYDPFGDVSFYPLGSYPTVQSPWGLLDTAGVTSEWNEEIAVDPAGGVRFRGFDGSYWFTGGASIDTVWNVGAALPNDNNYTFGFRVAAVVPSPSTLAYLVVCCLPMVSNQRR